MIISINGQEISAKDIVKGSYQFKRKRIKIKSWRNAIGDTINEYYPNEKIVISFALAERRDNEKLRSFLYNQSKATVNYFDEITKMWMTRKFEIADCTVKHKYDSEALTWYDATVVTLEEL